MGRLLPYFAARQIALDMDRRGERPGLALRLLIGVPSALVLVVSGAMAAFLVCDFALWRAGLIP
jgi:hypothetical protein